MQMTDAVTESVSSPDLLERLIRSAGAHASAATIFGEPVRQGDVTIVPVGRASFGAGRGGSRDGITPGPNMGGGARVSPVGYIEIRGDQAAFHRITTTAPWLPVAAAAAAGFVLGLMARRERRG